MLPCSVGEAHSLDFVETDDPRKGDTEAEASNACDAHVPEVEAIKEEEVVE
jgi:hypothetical protein